MNLKYKLGILTVGALALGSCANHDLIADNTQLGQAVPTCYYELGTNQCKAGESFTFLGKYYVEPGKTPDRSEIWYLIERQDVAAVSAKLGGSTLNYTSTVTLNDTMRAYQPVAVFPHSAAEFNGHEYLVNGSVNVSRTLAPVMWSDAAEWNQRLFDSYYPEGFADNFKKTVIGYLTDESSAPSYYNALRAVYLNYNFTNEQFKAVGLPEIDTTKDDGGTSEKSDLWFSTTEAKDDAIVGYYYITYDTTDPEKPKTIYHEVGKDYTPTEGQVIYPVYKAAEWVFCRYDDNSGSIVSSVRPEWLPKFKTLIENIPFQDWIYDSANRCFKVDFSRKYVLRVRYKVYDTDVNECVAYYTRDVTIS